ncbi:MAG: hypothetical protein MJ003_05220 [Paludibacteraceae bacterium]|nr:hypothetical protein [Paludibacteraceae bacterium]
MRKIFTKVMWLASAAAALCVCQSAFAEVALRPGSEYVESLIIRDFSNPASDPKPFKLTVSTLESGNVAFKIESADETAVSWRDQGLIVDSDKALLWTQGGNKGLREYFQTKKMTADGAMVDKVDGLDYFELVPKEGVDVPVGSKICYLQGFMYNYGKESRSTEVHAGVYSDYFLYTYGTTADHSELTAVCSTPIGNADNQYAYITAATDDNGVITFVINSNADGSPVNNMAYYRNNGFSPENMYVSSESDFTVCGKQASEFYTRVKSDQVVTFTPINGVTIPEDLVLTNYDQNIEWRIEGGDGNVWGPYPFRYKIGTECILGNTIKVKVDNEGLYTADVNYDLTYFMEGAEIKIKYRGIDEQEYKYVENGAVITANPYTITGLKQGGKYYVVVEGAYPSFEEPQETVASAPMEFQTETAGSEVCDRQFTADITYWIGVSMETLPSGNVALAITSSYYDGAVLVKEAMASDINYYAVEAPSLIMDAPASEYFSGIELSADMRTATLMLKEGVTMPEGAVIKLAGNGKIVWKEGNTTRWVDNQEQFTGFKHTYGTFCCAVGVMRIETLNVGKFNASFMSSAKCLENDGYTYQYNFKYRLADSTGEYTNVAGEGNVYQLTDLIPEHSYEIVFEAATPSFEEAERYESEIIVIATKGADSEACKVPFTSGGSNIGVSIETSIEGNLVVSLSSEEAELMFRNEGLTQIGNYKVNSETASTYFNQPVFEEGLTSMVFTLKENAEIPEGAVITFNGVVAWSTEINPNAYELGVSLTHTYGSCCCEAPYSITILSAEGISDTEAEIEIENRCIMYKEYQYRYTLSVEGVPSDPVEFTDCHPLTITGLQELTTYGILVEASADFEAEEPVIISDSGEFTTQKTTEAKQEKDSKQGLYSKNGTIFCDEPFIIKNLIGVDVTAQNGNLFGNYMVVTEGGTRTINVVR